MKKSESNEYNYINANIVIIYVCILISLIFIFEWVRKCRKDTKKEYVPDAFQKMVNCIGLHDMSTN